MPTNSSLNKIFVYVPSAEVAGFKTGAGLTNAYKGKISFLAGTGEIMTNGEIFAMNRDADIQALQDLLGTNSNTLVSDLGFNASTIVGAINYVYDLVNTNTDELEERLDTIQGTGDGSITKAVNDAISALVNNAPDALDTLKEIADWISRDGADATNLVTRMEEIEAQVEENEQVTAGALIDLQKQIDEMTGGAGSISQQINAKVETLDSSLTLGGSTVAQPQNIDIETSIDVLGSVTISETDGKLDAEAAGKSAKLVLQADAAGAAKKAYDVLYGDVNTDTTNSMTMVGLRARIDDLSAPGTLSVSTNPLHSVEFDDSLGDLIDGTNLANTLNSIQMWETYTSE
jgi:hypothetical protein